MTAATEPAKWALELGASADTNTIPEDSSDGALSMRQLFPPVTSLPLPAGGVAPSRKDMNGVLKLLGDSVWYVQHGGVPTYAAAFDYAPGNMVLYSGSLWLCVAANGPATSNVTAPGNDGAIWQRVPTEREIKAGITIHDLCPDGAAQHNALYGGRDITAMFDSGEYSESVADGSFRGIFPGDFIRKTVTVGGTAYDESVIIGDCDHLYLYGDTPCATHHCAVFPDTPLGNSYMNATNTTEGAYVGSYMYKTTLPPVRNALRAALGASHLVTFRLFLTNAMNAQVASMAGTGLLGAASGAAWADCVAELMGEGQVYGAKQSSGRFDRYDTPRVMAVFQHSPTLRFCTRSGARISPWLRDVSSAAGFASAAGYGIASYRNASDVVGVRPFALLA